MISYKKLASARSLMRAFQKINIILITVFSAVFLLFNINNAEALYTDNGFSISGNFICNSATSSPANYTVMFAYDNNPYGAEYSSLVLKIWDKDVEIEIAHPNDLDILTIEAGSPVIWPCIYGELQYFVITYYDDNLFFYLNGLLITTLEGAGMTDRNINLINKNDYINYDFGYGVGNELASDIIINNFTTYDRILNQTEIYNLMCNCQNLDTPTSSIMTDDFLKNNDISTIKSVSGNNAGVNYTIYYLPVILFLYIFAILFICLVIIYIFKRLKRKN